MMRWKFQTVLFILKLWNLKFFEHFTRRTRSESLFSYATINRFFQIQHKTSTHTFRNGDPPKTVTDSLFFFFGFFFQFDPSTIFFNFQTLRSCTNLCYKGTSSTRWLIQTNIVWSAKTRDLRHWGWGLDVAVIQHSIRWVHNILNTITIPFVTPFAVDAFPMIVFFF